MKISNQEIESFKYKIENDKLEYFEACSNNYQLYIEITQYLYPDIFKKIEDIDKNLNPYEKFVLEAKKLSSDGLPDEEIKILEEGIKNEVYIPGLYERLAILYSKKKKIEQALNVCQKWFNNDYWKLPNMASTSKRLLIRKQKLEQKLRSNEQSRRK